MKLDRNINPDGRGKYALLKLRNTDLSSAEIRERVGKIVGGQVLQFGDNEDTEFFVIKLKDIYAAPALIAYAKAAQEDGEEEYAQEIFALAEAAQKRRNKRKPD